jgi:hypothetical protein
MSLSVYFSHGRPCIQLNWNDLIRVSSYIFFTIKSSCHLLFFVFLPGMSSLWYFRNILNFRTRPLTFGTFLFKSLAFG